MNAFKYLPVAVIAVFLSAGCNDKDSLDSSGGGKSGTTVGRFTNPVIYADNPDPSVILDSDGRYYLYATGSYLNMYFSSDLVSWRSGGSVFTSSARPSDATYLWAPDINYFDGQYVLYYTAHVDGVYTDYVNAATADAPTGLFTNRSTVITYADLGVPNSIDQCFWEEDDGSKWMFWGSFNGIYAIELSDDGLSVKEGATKQQVAGTTIEGTMIYKRDGYYYMIGSAGSYAGNSGYTGVGATYHLVVARAESLLGPYRDKDGGLTVTNHFSEFLNASDEVYGPGHNSEILEMSDGSTWFLYHGWPASSPDFGRVVYLSQIFWDNTGWPYVVLNKPSVTWDTPAVTPQSFTCRNVDYIDFSGVDAKERYVYDTGYVPNADTRVELKFRAYSAGGSGSSAKGSVRRVFQANTSATSGFSLYINSDGDKLGFSNYGDDDGSVADFEYDTDYEITASLSELTVNGKAYSVSAGSADGKWERITLFGGKYDYPLMGRIYYFKLYEGSKLIHDFEPVLRNEDGLVMFHDTVSDAYYLPFDTAGFGYGTVVD